MIGENCDADRQFAFVGVTVEINEDILVGKANNFFQCT